MIHKLTPQVWFGNWEAPSECIGQVGTIINVAHNFSLRKGRRVYWDRLKDVKHEVFYARLAKKDREDWDENYYFALAHIVRAAQQLNKFPILTHCQLGGHRGPSSAIFTAWMLGPCTLSRFEQLHDETLRLCPRLARGSNYYHSMLKMCRDRAVEEV